MSDQITNYKCPACGGPLHFSEETGKVVCDYCDSVYEIAYIEDYYAKKDAEAAKAKEEEDAKNEAAQSAGQTPDFEAPFDNPSSGEWESEDGVRVYKCPSCGAQLVLEETTGASSCPYCGNPAIIPGSFSGALKPDYVIPFAVTKDEAVAKLSAFYRKKRFLPKAFSAHNHIKEVQGVYVPFWLYSGTADANVRFHGTRSHMRSTPTENITITEHFDIFRSGSLDFDKIPADGSSKMPDDYMDAIEPYDYTKLVPYSAAYLPGFLADKYDVTSEDCATRATNRARNSAIDAMRSDVFGYENCTITGSDVEIQGKEAEYALLPVWVLHTKYNNEDYLFTVNGQTGKMAGRLPSSKGRMAAWFFGIFGALWLVFSLAGAALI